MQLVLYSCGIAVTAMFLWPLYLLVLLLMSLRFIYRNKEQISKWFSEQKPKETQRTKKRTEKPKEIKLRGLE
jgi:hypothetical protein